jgi:hypothetical protein
VGFGAVFISEMNALAAEGHRMVHMTLSASETWIIERESLLFVEGRRGCQRACRWMNKHGGLVPAANKWGRSPRYSHVMSSGENLGWDGNRH